MGRLDMIPIGASDPSTPGGRTSSQHNGTLLAHSRIACIAEASLCSHVHARTDAIDGLSTHQTASDDSSDECLHDLPPNLVDGQGSEVGALQRCHSEVPQRTRSVTAARHPQPDDGAWSTRWNKHCEGIDSEVFKPTLSSEEVKIHKKISEGGSSEVFRGRLRRQQGTGHVRKYRVAIKVLHQNLNGQALKQAADDLKAEAAILSSFENANIIKCYGTCHVDRGGAGQAGSAVPAPSLVLECMRCSLEEYLCTAYPSWLVSSGSCSREHLLLLMVHLLEAVAAIADRSLIHRDIKPANCLLSADYRMLKIADFGFCRLAHASPPFLRAPSHERTACDAAPSPDCLSLTGELGSYRYMAPEIFMNQVGGYGCKADVFSAAMVMYYIVTRRRPFDDLESKEAAHQMSFCGLRPSLSQGDLRWGAWKRDKSDMEDPLKSISFAISQGWAGEVEERHDARTMLRMVSDLYSEEAAVSIHCERETLERKLAEEERLANLPRMPYQRFMPTQMAHG